MPRAGCASSSPLLEAAPRAPVREEPPPRLAADALSVVTAAREQHSCCGIPCTGQLSADHLSSEPLPFSVAIVLPGQLRQGPADPLSGDHFPGAGLGCFTALTEHSLLFPFPTSSDGKEMSVIVMPTAGGKLLLI